MFHEPTSSDEILSRCPPHVQIAVQATEANGWWDSQKPRVLIRVHSYQGLIWEAKQHRLQVAVYLQELSGPTELSLPLSVTPKTRLQQLLDKPVRKDRAREEWKAACPASHDVSTAAVMISLLLSTTHTDEWSVWNQRVIIWNNELGKARTARAATGSQLRGLWVRITQHVMIL